MAGWDSRSRVDLEIRSFRFGPHWITQGRAGLRPGFNLVLLRSGIGNRTRMLASSLGAGIPAFEKVALMASPQFPPLPGCRVSTIRLSNKQGSLNHGRLGKEGNNLNSHLFTDWGQIVTSESQTAMWRDFPPRATLVAFG